jgi:uncharacterized protein
MHFERYAMTLTLPSLVVCLLLALPASAQNASPAKPLPERKDVVSWSTFAQVQLSRAGDRFEPQFSAAVAALDQKSVKVQGFMLPLDTGEKHALFVLSAVPPTCAFCMPAGPEAVVEVRAKQPLAYTDNAVTVTGKLSVLKADPTGVFYRLTEAVPAK